MLGGELQAKMAYADGPIRLTLRERLTQERDQLQARLDELNGLLAKLNAQPSVADLVDEVFRVVR